MFADALPDQPGAADLGEGGEDEQQARDRTIVMGVSHHTGLVRPDTRVGRHGHQQAHLPPAQPRRRRPRRLAGACGGDAATT